MSKEKVTLIKGDNGVGFAVWITRNGEVDLCVLPYSERTKADHVRDGYVKAGYAFLGVLHEVDMK